ncbi:hypothetical protein [Halorussus caseinilyticus]|uniref:Uncharacterized protein n=1 Tax=Halorussus caseinilyticus TaxID=3034025 RepID=A0ABD5WQQ3_9EURY|nr:hypothetical protein [Halorussus sp. DT72]
MSVEETRARYIITIEVSQLESPPTEEKEQARSDIRKSIPSGGIVAKFAPPQTTTEEPPRALTDERTVFTKMNTGSSLSRRRGNLLATGGADYDQERNRMTASVITAMGAGDRSEISRLGVDFRVEGNESRSAIVVATGEYEGLLTAVGSAASELSLSLNIVDQSTNAKLSTEIVSESGSIKDWKKRQGDFREGVQTLLRPDVEYTAYVELESYVDCYGVGEASTDFGPQDNDRAEPPHGVELESIEIVV